MAPARPHRWRPLALAAVLATLPAVLGPPQLHARAGGDANLSAAAADRPRSVLYVWAGDAGSGVSAEPVAGNEYDSPDHPDFLAVVDADPKSKTYGKVLRTVSVTTPPAGNEPHHLPMHVPRHCGRFVANGLYSDTWFTFDLADPLHPALSATIAPAQTLGTVPQFAAVLPNCQVLATHQGGAAFDARGTVARFDAAGRAVLEERPAARLAAPNDLACTSQWETDPAASGPGGPYRRKTSSEECLPPAPLGAGLRADLATLVTSDFSAPLPLLLPVSSGADITAMTVRHFPLDPRCTAEEAPPPTTRCVGEPRVVLLPDGPRDEPDERHEENVVVEGLAVTNPAGKLNPTGATPAQYVPSKGAFAATTCGGALYYTADITAAAPVWREVFDFSAAHEAVAPGSDAPPACAGGGGLVVTPDNRYVIASVIGREPGQRTSIIGPTYDMTYDIGAFAGMVVMLDVRRLLLAGGSPACSIDRPEEVRAGGAEADCPAISHVRVVDDPTSGGPHDLALDAATGRLAFFDYFASETGVGGDLRVCILRIEEGELAADARFPSAVDGQPRGAGCISFERADWPGDRGAGAGPAKPHHGLFWSL